jgi:hypothetical protein
MKSSVKVALLRARSTVIILAIVCVMLVTTGLLPCTAATGQSATEIPSTLFDLTLTSKNNWPQNSLGALGKGTEVNWSYSEPQKGVFNWANLDAWVNTASAHGVDFFFSNDLVPPWAAADQSSCAPTYPGSSVIGCSSMVANIQDWADFVTALATRYKGKMIYELWNEPQYAAVTPTDMATLATHAYNIIRSVDPGALILAPSGSSNYMDQYYAAGGPTGVDVVTLHCYRASPETVIGDINDMKTIMAKYSLFSKPLWDTEGSWGTFSLSTDEQTGFVARYYLLQWSMGVSRFYWYAWDNAVWGTLWDPTNGLHPAAVSYQQVYNWMVGATLSSPCTMASDSTWTCTLTRPGGYQALAVWNSASTTSYTPTIQYKQYLDLAGNTKPVNGALTIGYNPILLVSSSRPDPPTISGVTVK